VLITGLGLIGFAIARRLVALGAEVLLVDSNDPEYRGNLSNITDFRDRVSNSAFSTPTMRASRRSPRAMMRA